MGKPPPGMDMFGEMEWKKAAKAAKAKWEAHNPDAAGADSGGGGGGGGGGSKAAASGPEQYGGPVDGKYKMSKPPPGMDMFAEMEWKKKAKAAKAEWEAANGGAPAAGGGGSPPPKAAAAPSGPEQYGDAVDGKWKNNPVPELVAGDMFAEMAWKKQQKAAKAEWEAAQ